MTNGIVVGANVPTMKAFITGYIQKAFEVETFAITMCEELCLNAQQDHSDEHSNWERVCIHLLTIKASQLFSIHPPSKDDFVELTIYWPAYPPSPYKDDFVELTIYWPAYPPSPYKDNFVELTIYWPAYPLSPYKDDFVELTIYWPAYPLSPYKDDFVELTIYWPAYPLSPYKDDFVVLHVREEYDTVMESVLKTEFLTLLSEKYTTLTRSTLPVNFGRRLVTYV